MAEGLAPRGMPVFWGAVCLERLEQVGTQIDVVI